MSTTPENAVTNPEDQTPTLTDAVAEMQKVVSHNAQVTMSQYENLINGVRLNNLLINAIIRKVGLDAEEVKVECDKIRDELIAQAEEEAKESEDAEQSEGLSMSGGDSDHPPEASVFGG